MLNLKDKSQSIRVLLAAAKTTNELPVVCTYADGEGSRRAHHTVQTQTNGVTAVEVLNGGGDGGRDVESLSIQNADTAAATATIQFKDGATTRTVKKVTLAVGDQLTWSARTGLQVHDVNGNLKLLSKAAA